MVRPIEVFAIAAVVVAMLSACGGGDNASPIPVSTTIARVSEEQERTTTTSKPVESTPEDGTVVETVAGTQWFLVHDDLVYILVTKGASEDGEVRVYERTDGGRGLNETEVILSPELRESETASAGWLTSMAWAEDQAGGRDRGTTKMRLWTDSEGEPIVVVSFWVEGEGDGITAARNTEVVSAFDGRTFEELWSMENDEEGNVATGRLLPGGKGIGVMELCEGDEAGYCGLSGIDARTGEKVWHLPADDAEYVFGFDNGDFIARMGASGYHPLGVGDVGTGELRSTELIAPVLAASHMNSEAFEDVAIVPHVGTDGDEISSTEHRLSAVDPSGKVRWTLRGSPALDSTRWMDPETGLMMIETLDDTWLAATATDGNDQWSLDADQSQRFNPDFVWPGGVAGGTPTGDVLLAAEDGEQSDVDQDSWPTMSDQFVGHYDDAASIAFALTGGDLVLWQASKPPIAVAAGSGDLAKAIPVFKGPSN